MKQHELRPGPVDLFGETPVTYDEIAAWLRAVPGLNPEHWRAAVYAKQWNVIEKIRYAKRAGTWPPAPTQPSQRVAAALLRLGRDDQ